MKRMAALLALLTLGGCVPHVVYKPSSLVSEKPVIPLRVAIQPFKDGTDDPPARKMILIPAIFLKSKDYFNFAKPMGNMPAILPAELWSKSLAAELHHSGYFTEAKFGQDLETGAPDLLIEGTLLKAEVENRIVMIVIFPVYVAGSQDYSFSLRVVRAGDRKILWSGKVERSIPKLSPSSGEGYAAIMQSMMVEAAQNLVKAYQASSAEWQTGAAAASPAPAAGTVNESVEDILKRITR